MVLDRFKEICGIPRGSGFNEQIGEYLVEYAKRKYLKYVKDDAGNVVIYRRASFGYEKCPPLIFQGHMDMVCEKTVDSEHDFTTEGIDVIDDGEYISANGTTLGADDGIAIAYMLELLSDNSITRPPYEMVFTVDEEIGMDGAKALDASVLKGRHIINIDSEDEGIFIAGCAGGASVSTAIPIEREKKHGRHVVLTIKGLKGGHSGQDIDKNRSNANLLMGRLLFDREICELAGLVSIKGGNKDNVIPNECTAVLIVDRNSYDEFISAISYRIELLEHELKASEPDVEFDCSHYERADSEAHVLDEESFMMIMRYINTIPNGVRKMSAEIEGVVESSANLAIIDLDENAEEISFITSLRSMKHSYIEYMKDILRELAGQYGGEYNVYAEYPGYDMKRNSTLRDIMCEAYESVTGEKPVITSIHAGLEMGIFAEKIHRADIVSIGPNVSDIHTVNEKLDIKSCERTWELIKKTVSDFAEKYKDQ